MVVQLKSPTSGQNLLSDLLKTKTRKEIELAINSLSNQEIDALRYDWSIWARDNQKAPTTLGVEHYIWMILAGRGFGKTRSGAEFVRQKVYDGYMRGALIGPTPADARDFMVEGDAGILSVFPPHERPFYEPSKRRITFHTGAIATVYSGYKPDQLRGPSHDFFWADELASWKYVQETWDMLMFGLRLGKPQGIITTTPRPLQIIKDLKNSKDVALSVGTSYDNRENLAPEFFNAIIRKYEGTRLGRQELHAQILDDNPNALWKRADIDNNRVEQLPELRRVVIGIDPSVSNKETSDDVGIIAVGLGYDGFGYVLEDATLLGTPDQWGRRAISLYSKYRADRIIAEINQGGNMVEYVLRTIDKNISYKGVHASKGKVARAEPIAALYEQNKVKHVGIFPQLEDELCEWEYGMPSPNRLDALVWALTELMVDKRELRTISKRGLGI